MGHYVINFTVYTLAMSGIIFFAFFVYKKIMQGQGMNTKTKTIEIEETMPINPRKSLMIVRVGSERFLIASDMDKTSLISKLGVESDSVSNILKRQNVENNIDVVYSKKSEFSDFMDSLRNGANDNSESVVYNRSNLTNQKSPIHLEVITDKNPHIPRKRALRTSGNNRRTVTIDVDSNESHGLARMKEMAYKVNRL